MTMQTTEQRRAADALARVTELERKTPSFKKRYRAYVERLGPAIVMTGLGQALATERAAAGNKPEGDDQQAHGTLYNNLEKWLCRSDGVYPGAGDLLEAITKHDQARYLVAQAEALAWLEWHKKFCRAAFPRESEG